MGEVFLIKGRKVMVKSPGSLKRKKELAEKFMRCKEDVERYLSFNEGAALEDIQKKGIHLPETNYTISEVLDPIYCSGSLRFEVGFDNTLEVKFTFYVNPERNPERIIHEGAIYHEVTHYILRLNLIKRGSNTYFLSCLPQVALLDEGFSEFVARHLTGLFIDKPRIDPSDNLFQLYEGGFKEVESMFISLGRDPKKLLDKVTTIIIDRIENDENPYVINIQF